MSQFSAAFFIWNQSMVILLFPGKNHRERSKTVVDVDDTMLRVSSCPSVSIMLAVINRTFGLSLPGKVHFFPPMEKLVRCKIAILASFS